MTICFVLFNPRRCNIDYCDFLEWSECKKNPVCHLKKRINYVVKPLQRSDSLNKPHSCTLTPHIMVTLYTPCAQKCFLDGKAEGKTNKQTCSLALRGETSKTAQTTPLLTACQSCRSPPLDPDPPQALLLEQSPHCVCLLWGVSLGERWAASAVATIGATWASRGFFSDGMVGGWAFVGGAEWMTDGVCVGTMPPARLSTCEKGQCAANLQCRFVLLQAHFGKRRINGWHKAGLRWWQMSFSFWFLTPFFFFANLDLLLLEKKKPSPLIVCFSHNLRSAAGLPH